MPDTSTKQNSIPGLIGTNLTTNPTILNYYLNTSDDDTNKIGVKRLMTLPRSLTIDTHGLPGLFGDDKGNNFNLSDIAKVMGSHTNDITNIFNGACYAGDCPDLETARKYFPNVQGLQHIPSNYKNSRLEQGYATGQFSYDEPNDPDFNARIHKNEVNMINESDHSYTPITNKLSFLSDPQTLEPQALHPQTMELWRRMHGIDEP